MGRKSTIATNPLIRKAVDEAINRGCTIQAITDMLDAMGSEISRSAVGRYASKYQGMAARQRDIRAAADAFASEFANAEDNQTRLMVQSVTTLITERIIGTREGEGSNLEIRLLAAAAKDAMGAAKIDSDLRRAIRNETLNEAANIVESQGKAAGASDELINKIKAELMGLTL
jgi:predicted transcriptional regulator